MAKASIRTLLDLVGEVEDAEFQAIQAGLDEAAHYLGLAKIQLVKELARLEAQRARVRVARQAAEPGGVIPFPLMAANRRRNSAGS